jgi:glutathione S-transferase
MLVFVMIYNQVDFYDPTHPYASLVKKVADEFKNLNVLLEQSSTSYFYDQDQPTVADYFVFYAFTVAKELHRCLVPAENESQLLNKHEQLMRARPALAKYFNEGRLHNRLSGSPTEEQYRAKLANKQHD